MLIADFRSSICPLFWYISTKSLATSDRLLTYDDTAVGRNICSWVGLRRLTQASPFLNVNGVDFTDTLDIFISFQVFYRIIPFNGKVWLGVNICVGGSLLGVLLVSCLFHHLWDILKVKNECDRTCKFNVADSVSFKQMYGAGSAWWIQWLRNIHAVYVTGKLCYFFSKLTIYKQFEKIHVKFSNVIEKVLFLE